MAEDLGQDVAEYLLNQRTDFLRYARMIYDFIHKRAGQAAKGGSGDEVVALDFETPEAAHEAQKALSGLGIESHVVASSVCLMERDLERAARGCEAIAEQMRAPSPITERQIAYIVTLEAQGHIPDDIMPDDLTKISSDEADALIRGGVADKMSRERFGCAAPASAYATHRPEPGERDRSIEGRPQPRRERDHVREERKMPSPRKERERVKPPATDAQIAYIGRLHERGHLLDEEVPRDLRALDVQQAHEVISKGEVRAIKERAKSDPVRLRDEGARARAASAALDRERGAKAHEKLIDRMQPAK